MAGIGCGWHGAQFDNFIARRLHRAGLNLAPAAIASASSVWSSGYTAAMANDDDFSTVWTDGQTAQNSGGSALHANFSLLQSQIIGVFNTLGQLVDAVDLAPQPPDASSGSNPDGDPVILNLLAATPRQSNNQIWALPPSRRAVDGAILLNFAGFPFASHRVLAADSLESPGWTNLALVSADGLGMFACADTNTSARNQRFYRGTSP
jgi:hypothetical protein